jgi:succinate dehydrogenase/fumarate reductase flavoprotein subunit
VTTNSHLTEEVDLVVVGSGTGLMSAITAAEFGLRVLVVEKSEYLGGSTAMSGGGFWIPDNPILRDLGVHGSRECAMVYLDALVGDTAPRERRVAHLEHGPKAIEVLRRNLPNRWLHMVEYADYFPEVDGGSAYGRALESAPFDLSKLGPDRPKLRPTPMEAPVPMPVTGGDYRWMNLMMRKPRGLVRAAVRAAQGAGGMLLKREYASAGQALAAGLIIAARRLGVRMWTESPLRDLVFEDGRVVGVVVERDGKNQTVRARRGVVLSAGGFEHNIEMRHEHQSKALEPGWSLANPANQGDVIRIAESHGAALTLMDQAWWFPAIPPVQKGGYPSTLLAERSLPGSIIVGPDGRRFMNEAVNYMTAGQIMLGLDDGEDPHLPAWIVFDQTYRNRYVFGGGIMPRQDLPEEWYAQGLAHRAATLDELAQKVGLPELRATVERFNLMADKGHDDDFHRGDSAYDRYYGDPKVTPNPNLGALRKPPFYAVRVVPGDLGTCGGIMADGFARVLRASGEVIEGLYATGNCAGNAFGKYYPGPGATIGQGLSFGYIAAAHAAGRLKEEAREGEPAAA